MDNVDLDIYGWPLKPGHCYAHPHIEEPYPCQYCLNPPESMVRKRAPKENEDNGDEILADAILTFFEEKYHFLLSKEQRSWIVECMLEFKERSNED